MRRGWSYAVKNLLLNCCDIWNIICDLDEERKADYKQFQQVVSIKQNRSDKPEITAINSILQKHTTKNSC